MRNEARVCIVLWLCVIAAVSGASDASSPAEPASGIEIDQVRMDCRIDGRQLAVTVGFDARTEQAQSRMLLVQGDAVLEKLDPSLTDGQLGYDPNDRGYYVVWPGAGRHRVGATFIVQSSTESDNSWRQSRLQAPGGRVRQIRLTASQPDLEVQLPGALRMQRRVEQGELVVEALLGPRAPLEVRWKPQLKLADARLVMSSRSNTVVDVRAGLVQIDSLFDFDIAQGKLETLTFHVPKALSITAVHGASIRMWDLGDATAEGVRTLHVELSRAQGRNYSLRVLGECAIETLPATVEVPVIEPTGDIRASGHLAVGTNSALQLVVQESSGLTQVDAAAFPRVQAPDTQVRPIPQGKAFFYTYAGSRYRLRLRVDDIVPTYEAAGRLTARVKDDDLVVDVDLELDVRDAPLRQLELALPAGLVLATVDGNQVDDYHLPDAPSAGQPATVRVVFKEPVIGRTLLRVRLELGRGPLGEGQTIPALQVVGAKTQRGYVVVAAEPGIEIDPPQVRNLREVHTASVPLRVAQAQYAYRFREADWTLDLMARRRPAEVRAEVFHLHSISETLAHGSAVINYLITGSPLDELTFRLPDGFENVEFVGRDVRRWVRQDGAWVVKLTRKVLGDYSLAVTYTQRYGPDRPIQLGALHCENVQTQTGYVVVTSHLDLRLQLASEGTAGQGGLLPIALDELPGDYRLLTSSPILSACKYVNEPHTGLLAIDPYQRSDLLPVVVDIANLETKLAALPDGQIESMTTVRYKVKNTTGQFLALAMPEDARVWAVSLIEPGPGGEQSTRLAASHDPGGGQLLIPLRRQVNPNDPATIELQYGQVHGAGTWWKRRVDLAAPRCTVPVVYADWQVIVPQRWAILPAGGSMQPRSEVQSDTGLASLAGRVGSLWGRAFERVIEDEAFWVFGGVAAVLAVVLAIFRRQNLPHLIVLYVLICALWIGIIAGLGHVVPPQAQASLSCAQAASVDPNQALLVSAELVPAWRQALGILDAVIVGVALVVGAVLLVVRRLRIVAFAVLAAALVYVAAKMPLAWPVLEALATWFVPAAALAWFALRLRPRRRTCAAVIAVTWILLVACVGGCSTPGAGSRLGAGDSTIERIECSLTAGADSVEIKYELRVSATRPACMALLDESAVLISSARLNSYVRLRMENGRHVLCVDRPGVYDLEATFLAALPPAAEDQQRRFELALPVALTNRVSLVIPDANVLVEAPQAALFTSAAQDGQTRVEAMFTPGQHAMFTWRPLERQAAQEAVRFYAQDVALANVTPGLLQVFHEVRLRIAQGQVDRLTLDIPAGQTATSVQGAQMAAWRFDPVAQQLEVRLGRAMTGSYAMTVVTQSANRSVPYDVRVEPLVVRQALDQHSVVGLAAEPSVYVRVDQHPAPMNVQDYVREAGELVKSVPAVEQIAQAFRFESKGSAVTGHVQVVQSEVRSVETARFNVEDDRLVYNSQWDIEIAKAGRFDLDLLMPEGFDIDALEAQEVSHWDESVEADQRRVRVHFKHRLTGTIRLRLALSRAVAEIPDRLTVPRVTVAGGIKHSGNMVIGSEQGVRVSVASRQGVSELNPAELSHAGTGLLAFQFLRPDWQLELQTELIHARVTVQSLHVAKVTDGLVRHQHALRYRLYHAGTKTFDLTLPADAVGATITGPGITRREQSGPGQWRVELADKVYDQPYLMTVTYETRYDPADGNIPLVPVRCRDADLQDGYTAVFATERVELATESMDAALRPADARSIPMYFGAGDLSAAAMCYRNISAQYSLVVKAKRHAAADQIGAEVLRTDLVSVVTAAGKTINRVVLLLRVGSRRHLQMTLPDGAAMWSVAVDGQAVQPSLRTTAAGHNALLVPLPQQASDDVLLDMVYLWSLPSAAPGDWSGRHVLSGPRFDLPLKNIAWQVYAPQGYAYGDFGGTVAVDPRVAETGNVLNYDLQTYQQQILTVNRRNEQVAQQQQSRARELAQKGEQTAARQALTKGYNFSLSNTALNEDIRVDLDNLLRQQAKAGLINARDRLRRQTGAGQGGLSGSVAPLDSQVLSGQQVERLGDSLGQADNENLEQITRRILQAQAAAETSVSQIQVTVPTCGQVLRFESPLQVEPTAGLAVAFTARPHYLARIDPNLWYGLGLFLLLLVCGTVASWLPRPWDALCVWLQKPVVRPARMQHPAQASEPRRSDDNEPPSQVSAEELL